MRRNLAPRARTRTVPPGTMALDARCRRGRRATGRPIGPLRPWPAAWPPVRSLGPGLLTRFAALRAPQKPKRSAFASKFGNSKAAALLASFNAVPIGAGSAAVDAFARNVIARAGADAPEHFYVFDLGAVLERLNVWTTSLPRVTPYYAGASRKPVALLPPAHDLTTRRPAVKCNPDRAMLSLLAAMGTGFDCASPAEIELVRSMGVGPDRIIYAHCCKMPRDLAHAASVGIQLTTFDNEAELYKVAKLHPNVGLVLRIRADDQAARCNLGDKYGAEEDEIEPLLRTAKELGLNVVGISFHVGSGARNPAAFPIAVGKARLAFDLATDMGFQMRVLDLGGGYSGNLTEGITMAKVAESLNAALDAHFPASSGVKIIAEPGRYFAEPSMTLHTRIFGKRVRERGAGVDSRYYWIADGVYGSMNCQIFDHAEIKTRPFPLEAPAPRAPSADGNDSGSDATMSDGDTNAPKMLPSTLYGPTCDGMDTLLRGCMLPELDVGDWLAWDNFGAYTLAAGSAFNGFDSQAVDVHYVVSASS
jgi:ornithine decarboxylase